MLPLAVVRGRWRLSAGGRGEYVAKLRGRPVTVLGRRLGAGGGPRASDSDVGQLAALDAGKQFPVRPLSIDRHLHTFYFLFAILA
jgi:hypothetical protein